MPIKNNDGENNLTEEIQELKNLINFKKSKIKYRTFNSSINGDYRVKIGGIGNKSIKFEIFIDYETLLKNKNGDSLESCFYDYLIEAGEK